MENALIDLKRIIESNGYKFTRQKQLILKALIESNTHLNAEEIYQKVKNSSMGLATVYRNLKTFCQLNIVKEINITGRNYYEMKIFSKKSLHIHFKCIQCNQIIDIDNRSLDYLRINRMIEKDSDLLVFDADIMLIGLCSQCKKLENK